MSRDRDNQRSRVYRSEWKMREFGRIEFNNVRELQRFTNTVTNSSFWKSLGKLPRFVVAEIGRSDSNVSRSLHSNRIRIAPSMLSKMTVLHELTHTAMRHIDRSAAAHGPEYVLLYRRFVEEFLGTEARQQLDLWFEHNNVNWSANTRLRNALGGR